MMKEKTKFSPTKFFYNNKVLFVISVLISIALWMAVKVNFSGNVTRTISDVKIDFDLSLAQESDYQVFLSEEDKSVDVEISGKSYDVSSTSFSKEDIIVEAASGYVDAAGYKVLNISARSNNPDAQVVSVYPSTITVYFDRLSKGTFNVVANLSSETEDMSEEGYLVGKPVPSMNTVEVSGPASVLSNLNKVVFDAEINPDSLPLTQTTEVPATISYDLKQSRGSKYLTCESVNDETKPATVTIPVTKFSTIPATVNFVNEPKSLENKLPEYTITPSEVRIASSSNTTDVQSLTVGTVDFNNLDNKLNKFSFKLDKNSGANVVDTIESFDVEVDMSSYSKKTVNVGSKPKNVVFLSPKDGYSYSLDSSVGSISKIVVIGPADKINKITADNIQIEINVATVNSDSTLRQRVDVSNISILGEASEDCWVYGTYYTYVNVSKD